MSDDLAISVENVSKAYRIWNDPAARLKSPLCDGLAGFLPAKGSGHAKLKAKAESYYRDFYALKDISFQVRKGESVGIIGRNGSGKSTLLQIIAGTLRPTTGSVRVNGRVAALLELGSGFNPDFTGRENVYLNAAVLGLTRSEVDAKFDSIAAFADIGDFLDQPVKTYSSGMMMRLAFAVQTAVEPDILIVDEALSVGDEAFQRKCFARLESIKRHGSTLLFVSHSAGQIIELCSHAILLANGKIEADGQPKSVVNLYHKRLYGGDALDAARSRALDCTLDPALHAWTICTQNTAPHDDAFFQPDLASRTAESYPQTGATIRNPRILGSRGQPVNNLSRGHTYIYTYEVEINAPLFGVRFGGLIKTITGIEIAGMASHRNIERLSAVTEGQCFSVRYRFHCRLLPGTYFLNAGALAIAASGKEYFAHRLLDAIMFRVIYEPDLPVNALVDMLDQVEIAPVQRPSRE